MKKVLLVVLTFTLMISVNAKEPELLWEKTWNYGKEYISMFSDTATDSKGNHYAVGSYSDPYASGRDYYEATLNKYDKDGSIIWERKYNNENNGAVFLAVDTLSDDGSVVLGLYYYNLFSRHSLTSSSKKNSVFFGSKYNLNNNPVLGDFNKVMFLIRYDKDGNIKWERSISVSDYGENLLYSNVEVTDDDEIYVFVYDFDETLYKYDKNGTRVWSNTLYNETEDENSGTSTYNYTYDGKKDNDGNYIVVGTYEVDVKNSSGEGDKVITTYEGTITKIDKNNKTIFSKKYRLNNKDTEFISVAPLDDDKYLVYASNMSDDKNIKFYLITFDKDGNKISEREVKTLKIDPDDDDTLQEYYDEFLTKIYIDKQGNYAFVNYFDSYESSSIEYYLALYYGIQIKSINIYDKDMKLLWTRNSDLSKELLVRFNINDYNDFLIVGSNFTRYVEPPQSSKDNFPVFSDYPERIQDSALIMKYSTDYKIDKEVEGKGSVDVSLVNAKAGDEITIDAKPEEGYRIEKIIVTDKNGKVIEVSGNKFIMPANDVNVKVIFTDSPLVNPKTGAISITFAVLAISVYAFFQYKYIKTKEMSL